MDKIVTGDWMNSFSQVSHSTIQAGPRYFETVSTSDEPGLASAKSWHIKMPGMLVQLVRINPQSELLLQTSEERESIQSAFILNGYADSTFSERPVTTQGNSHAFQYSPTVEETHKIKHGNLDALHIEFETDFFKDLIQSCDSRWAETICNNLEKKETYLISPSLLPLQARMTVIINDIKNCPYTSLSRSIFMEAKILELFALQLEQITGITSQEKALVSKIDKEKLFLTKEFIEKNYLQPLSLRQLGLMFGLNEFKLKKGYKLLFNTTVFGHINHLRMQKAMQLLSQKRLTVTEVANLIGYSSAGNFSSEFKKKFGCPPTKASANNGLDEKWSYKNHVSCAR